MEIVGYTGVDGNCGIHRCRWKLWDTQMEMEIVGYTGVDGKTVVKWTLNK